MKDKIDTIAEIKKLFPDVNLTVNPALNNAKGSANPKKMADIKKILSKIKMPPDHLKATI